MGKRKFKQSKGLVIVLSNLEKKSFFSFLALYIGSSILMIAVIAILYFNSISQTIFESKKDKMRSFAASIAAKVIQVHMHGGVYILDKNMEYEVGLYDGNKNILYGNELSDIDFNKVYYEKDNMVYIVDQSTQMHLGVKYIVIKDSSTYEYIQNFKKKVILYTFLVMLFVIVIGYFLSRLFLKPIASEREKLDNFIKNTTHELNTPITALLMSINNIKDTNNKSIERIKISANRISNIYSDLCYLISKDFNEDIEIEKINIKSILEEQVILFEGYAKSKNIIFVIQADDSCFHIDIESIKRIVSNIISNALKYSKPNNKIDITLENNILIVKDYGVGIETKELNKITHRYYRANSSEGGFGIGLDIVNDICKRYKLKLEITSSFGNWTEVKVYFTS